METLVAPLPYGPLLEAGYMGSGLDYYKPSMSQLQFEKQPDAEVTFSFHNRGDERLADYIDPAALQTRLDTIGTKGWSNIELGYFASLMDSSGKRIFTDKFLNYLKTTELPSVSVTYDESMGDIAIETTGAWPTVTFWETIVMSEVNEAYFEGYVRTKGLDLFEIYDEGDRRLSEKIAFLRANPAVKFADFGTRRHFSLRWQRHVLERLQTECPDNLIGTSNVALARILDLKPIGTFAHEMPMVYAGLAERNGGDIRASHHQFLEDWFNYYGPDLSIALTDTFTSDFFFSDFTPEQAAQWRGLRHDSGDPIRFGEQAIAFYEAHGIDPATKTIVFSDGLDLTAIQRLHEYFKDRINIIFGWGKTLMNDLKLKPLNIVMKATKVYDIHNVKLGDDSGKHTGPRHKLKEYHERIFRV